MKSQTPPRWVLRPRVPEEVYTDRQEFLDSFYKTALAARGQRAMSTVLLGKRRMGKTEIFLRVVNRLFWEQDHRDPQAVVPVYYSFEDEPGDRWEFSIKYTENFIRWYTAFRLRDLDIFSPKIVKREDLPELLRSHFPMSTGLKGMINFSQFLQEKAVTTPEEEAVNLPVWVSDHDDIPIAVFLDEFQNTRLPHSRLRIVGYMQKAVESLSCPHFVTGSAMSILAREIIGRGSLFGRFDGEEIEPMTPYWGTELALRAARYYQADLSEEIAPALADRCGGNPFYITAVVRQAAKQHTALRDEKTINETLAVDLSSGFIWGELNDQVSRWIERMNEYGITKWVLYLSALEEGDRLDIERIQRELREREGKDIPLETIRDVLIKLSRGDLLEYMELGGWFRKVDDPILLDFLKVWGRIEVEGQEQGRVQQDLREQYKQIKRKFHEYKGYLGEIFMAQVLWNGQNTTLPGRFFHSEQDITIPWHFSYIHHRTRLKAGKGQEIDVLGAAGGDIWVCQSKWWTKEKVGKQELQALEQQGELAKQEHRIIILTLWILAYSGLTHEAEAYAREHGILWSSRSEFNDLLSYVGLRQLPEFSPKDEEKVHDAL